MFTVYMSGARRLFHHLVQLHLLKSDLTFYSCVSYFMYVVIIVDG